MPNIAVLRDISFAARSLRRAPGFTLIAVATLALGIGANTAMFSVLDGYLLRPSNYPGRDHVERLFRATREEPRGSSSPADYLDLQTQVAPYGEVAGYGDADISLAAPHRPAEMAVGLRVSANLFHVLGVEPRLGRGFRASEDTPGNHRVLVISHRFWQTRFGGDPGIVGKGVRVDGEPYEIVGVLPPEFSDWRHLSWADVYRPLALDEKESRDRSSTWVHLVGRRADGTSRAQSAAFVAGFGKRLAGEHPAEDSDCTWKSVPIDDSFLPRDAIVVISMLIGLSGFVLLIACSNLANLLLARSMARAREFALRAALGASRVRLLRPLFVESMLVALAGGAAALVVARWVYAWLEVASANENGVGVELHFDWRVLGWAFAVCVLTALAFGVAPAFFVQRLDLNSTLKSGGRGTTADRGHRRFRDALIVAQFALALVLLAGAGLYGRGLYELNHRRHGWDSDRLITGSMVLPTTTYRSDAEIVELQRRALERIEAQPGVAAASMSYAMPFFGLAEPRRFVVEGVETPQPGHEPVALINGVSPHYFATVGTRLLAGRAFDGRDTLRSPRVYVINESMAHALFGDASPLGRRLAQAGGKTREWGTVVGVAGDVQSVFAGRAVTEYQLYQPMTQEPRRGYELAVRSAGVAPSSLVDRVRATVMAVDADLPVRKLQPAPAAIARFNYQDGVLATMLTALAVLGLALASLGIYGVITRTVAQRRPEFGVRLAIGAQARDITRLVLGSGVRLALVGSTLGLLGAVALARAFASWWPSMHTSAVPVVTGVTALLVAIAQLACYLPARQAAKLDPSKTLWAE